MTHVEETVAAAADRLAAAAERRQMRSPVRDLLGSSDIVTAYAVRNRLTARRLATGAVVSGRRIGLTAPAVQKQLGVGQPDFGVLFADMDVSGPAAVPTSRLLRTQARPFPRCPLRT